MLTIFDGVISQQSNAGYGGKGSGAGQACEQYHRSAGVRGDRRTNRSVLYPDQIDIAVSWATAFGEWNKSCR